MSYPSEVLADSPTAYWRLGEAAGTFADSAGTNTATATGTPTRDVVNSALADDDGAVAFPTTGDYITAPTATALDLSDGPFTLEMWAKRTTDTAAFETAFHKGTNTYAVGVNSTDKFYLVKAGVAVLFTSSGNVPADDSWHHYVVTRSAAGTGNTKIYVDAVNVTVEVDTATTLNDGTSALEMGRFGASERWTGGLDEIAIYKSVLSATRVLAHYNARSGSRGARGDWRRFPKYKLRRAG